MPGLDIFRRSMPQSYNWTCLKGQQTEQNRMEIIDNRRKSLDKEGRRENLISMGRSIQNLLVMNLNKPEEKDLGAKRFKGLYFVT